MKKIILLLVTLSLLFFCKHSKDGIERYMEDGAEVIVNHLEPYKIKKESSTLHLEEEFMIDFEREDLTEIGIKEIVGFDVDSDRNIYFRLSSSSENYIYKFDDKGDFLFSFGRKGQGPGELESPRYLRVNKLDQIVVSDNRRNKLLLFEKNGDFIKGISLAPNYQIATLIERGKILVMKRSFNQEEGRFDFPVILCNEDLEETKMLHPGRYMPNFSFAKKVNCLRLYLDYNVWKISRALIYVGNYGQGYEFLIYDTEGNLSRKIRKEYHKVKVPDQVKDKIVNWLSENFDSFEKVKNKIYFPEFYPPFQFFFLDEKGRLYVMTYERGKSPNGFLYDIFNPDGLFIGRIELDNYGNLATSPIINPLPLDVVAKNNRLYCLREKESGFKELVVYQMRWE
jgi:hypothetical protein